MVEIEIQKAPAGPSISSHMSVQDSAYGMFFGLLGLGSGLARYFCLYLYLFNGNLLPSALLNMLGGTIVFSKLR